jgi:hypothetical protein
VHFETSSTTVIEKPWQKNPERSIDHGRKNVVEESLTMKNDLFTMILDHGRWVVFSSLESVLAGSRIVPLEQSWGGH